MAHESGKMRKGQTFYAPTPPNPSPSTPYTRTGTKHSKPVVVVVHQPSGPVKEEGTERPGYGGYYY
ncbi:hypothetical protein B0A55_02411 [Friedmanniomyces simplex]|uniref:Uncharacterized protein n=1 Tax=Friedmanniomyces simplex TaxID=329884 RepID=A0A4U0XUG7_9PEZI|nr:hypothetical protein B0A55_02411 [Friedmanniomyces simplex]